MNKFDPIAIDAQVKAAATAWPALATTSAVTRQKALLAMAQSLLTFQDKILAANAKDVERGRKNGLTEALIDRLTLTPERILGMSDSILQIANLADPLGEVLEGWVRPNGLKISKIRVPIGVIAMIYEARPNVTVDAIALGIKTGNAMILRGSASAYESNLAITNLLKNALYMLKINEEAIQLLTDTSHEGVYHLVKCREYIQLAIPRGGATLIQEVVRHAQVPTIETGVGNCHIFVDDSAALEKAVLIIVNAKAQRPSVCNACETVLIHRAIAEKFLPILAQKLKDLNVEIRGCAETQKIIACTQATDTDWDTEYLDLILAIKIVKDNDEAIAHIQKHGTHHTEAILSNNLKNTTVFKEKIDAAAVVVNASTRFIDGGEFGFGAELGISTQKLHARGPMGLAELTTYKYIVEGDGQTR